MALIACPECGKEISNQAPACIHCGCPLAPRAPLDPNRFSVVLTACPEDSEGRYRVRKLAIHLEESVWEAVYAFLSQPAAERALHPPDPSDPKGRLGAGRHPPRGGGRGAGARLHHTRRPPAPSLRGVPRHGLRQNRGRSDPWRPGRAVDPPPPGLAPLLAHHSAPSGEKEVLPMALISCPECGKQISDQAPACIHCGYPLPKQPTAPAAPPSPDRFSVVLTACPDGPETQSKVVERAGHLPRRGRGLRGQLHGGSLYRPAGGDDTGRGPGADIRPA